MTTKRQSVPRTRNGNSMTEAEYWQAIRGTLRHRFSRWKPATEALKAARRPRTEESGSGLHKFEYLCAICFGWFRADEVQADHVEPAGSLNRLEDLPDFVRRLTPEDPAAFQCVCKECHRSKSRDDRRDIKERRNGHKQGKLPW